MSKLEIKEVIRDGEGNIIAYELNTGSIIDNQQAVYMTKKGELQNVEIVSDKAGNETIKGVGFDINKLPEVR